MSSDEEKLTKFAAAFIHVQYLQFIRLTNNVRNEKATSDLNVGYQETLAILQKYLEKGDTNSLRIIAFSTQLLIEAQKYFEVDQSLIENSLNFIIKQQKSDGSFPYNFHSDPRHDMGTQKFRHVVFTALITSTFLKNDKINAQYQREVEKSLNYLKAYHNLFDNDHVKAIASYVFATSGDLATARMTESSLRNSFLISSHTKHKSMFVEIVSYKILTKIIFNEDARSDVEWLIRQRNADGGFISPYDTFLALKALFEYTKMKHPGTQNVYVDIDHQPFMMVELEQFVPKKLEISQNAHSLKFQGQGLMYVNVYYENIQQFSSSDKFKISPSFLHFSNNILDMKVSVELIMKDLERTNFAVIEVQLPSGYRFLSYESKSAVVIF